MKETEIQIFMKNVDGTKVICDKTDGIMVISNLVHPPFLNGTWISSIWKFFCDMILLPMDDFETFLQH